VQADLLLPARRLHGQAPHLNGAGVFLSTNKGTNWTAVNSGFTNLTIYSLAVSGGYLFAGSSGILGGVWRRRLSEVITSVNPSSTELPKQFTLEQNYPNPFNPSTTISYQLPASSLVTLKVFDLLGREIATLVNELQPAGTHDVR